ncbi:MAG: DUF1289 domain-containing protein [Rhodovibrionaceae bacterium]
MSEAFPIVSPCVGVCQLDPQRGQCLGCLRTREEIAAWPSIDDTQRLRIIGKLRERRRAAGRTSAADSKPRRRARRSQAAE